jgi:hypothetical protein
VLSRVSYWMFLPTVTFVAACATNFRFNEQRLAPPHCSSPNWCVAGTVIDRSSGLPVAGAQVLISSTACGALADSTGHFTLACSGQPGDTLVARGIGYKTFRGTVAISPGRHYQAEIRLKRVRPLVSF